MHTTEKAPLAKYVPAQLHTCKEWYISYYVLNPATNKLQLIRNRVNRVKKIHDRYKWAMDLVRDLNIKLASGWNPLIESQSTKGYYKLKEVLDTFLTTKSKELRPDSMRSYKSFVKNLKEFISKKEKDKIMYVISFTKAMAIDYLQECYMKNNISERAYNNHVAFCKLFFNWCIQLNYCKINPFESIGKKKEKQKTRIMIDQNVRNKMKNFLFEKDFEFFVICMTAFYALLRPKEITYMKIKDIDLNAQTIIVHGADAKNGQDRKATIPDVLKEYLDKMNIHKYDKECYLFSQGFLPGKVRIDGRVIAKKWAGLRNKIGIPMEMQFYSLRDTGIVQMIHDDVPLEVIRDQAGHSSLEITNVYTMHANNRASEDIKKKCKKF